MTEQNEHVVPDGFTEEDLPLGKKACKYIDILSTSALVACSSIAVFVFVSAPWNTFHSDPGKYGGYYPMQIVLSLPLLCILLMGPRYGRRRKPTDHHMRKGSRIGLYILGTSMILLCVWTQWILAGQIIEDGFTAKWRWEK